MRIFIALALGATCAGALAQNVNYSQIDSADARVYLFTPSPGDAEFMRMFGDGTTGVDPNGWRPDQSTWAYGYMQWVLTGFTPGTQYDVTSARLRVTHQLNPNWSPADNIPGLEVRMLGSNWDETFAFSNPNNPAPQSLLAMGDLSQYVATGADFNITFDLNTQAFEDHLNAALALGDKMSLAMTSAVLPLDVTPRRPYYSVYTRDAPVAGVAPLLEITATVIPEPGTIAAVGAGMAILALRRRK